MQKNNNPENEVPVAALIPLLLIFSIVAYFAYESSRPIPVYIPSENPDSIYMVRPIQRGCASRAELRNQITYRNELGLTREVYIKQ